MTEARPLRRSGDDKMLAGVAGGLARYLNADVTLVRVIIAALALCTGAGVAVYVAAWLLIPADGQDQPAAAAWIAARRDRIRYTPGPHTPDLKRSPITMSAIIALALITIVALVVLFFAVHVLFSPWLLVAIAILAWIKFRPRRSHR